MEAKKILGKGDTLHVANESGEGEQKFSVLEIRNDSILAEGYQDNCTFTLVEINEMLDSGKATVTLND